VRRRCGQPTATHLLDSTVAPPSAL